VSNRHANVSDLDDLTPMQQIVVQELRRGKSWVSAARAAGYSDPDGEVDRLKANRRITDAVLGTLQEKAASWELLVDLARRTLERNQQEKHNDWCRSLQPPDPEHGYADCNCWFGKLKPADANTAARITLDTVGRSDKEALATRARKEDIAITDDAAAAQFLGGSKPEGDRLPN
jgi:hypothetical protein